MHSCSSEVSWPPPGPFCDPVIQEVAIDRPLARDFDILIEVGYRPGVTDNVGRTAREAIQYLTGRPFAAGEGVYTSVQYLLKGQIDKPAAERIARGFLANGLIQRWTIVAADEFDPRRGPAGHGAQGYRRRPRPGCKRSTSRSAMMNCSRKSAGPGCWPSPSRR